ALVGRGTAHAAGRSPVLCTPPDVSKAQIPMAGLLARGSLPDRRLPGITQWPRRRLVAYSCGGSAGVEGSIESSRTGFPFHLPRGRTIGPDASGRALRGQPAEEPVDRAGHLASGAVRKGALMTSLYGMPSLPPVRPVDRTLE